MSSNNQVCNSIAIGDGANNFNIDSNGVAHLTGTAKRQITLRPSVNYTYQIAHAKPTQVTIGLTKAFSMPVFADDDEELFFKHRVPFRWDGESDVELRVMVALSAAEDVGDNFKFRLAWSSNSCGSVINETSVDVDVEQAVLTDRSAQYSIYCLTFVIDWDAVGNIILPKDMLNGRLRRIAATGTSVSNEMLGLDWALVYTVDKMFGVQ